MAALLNNCRFIPTAGGTTDWVYSSAVGGCQSPVLAGAVDGRKYKFIAISSDLTQWEIAEGAYTAASGTFARTTVYCNSSGSGAAAGQSGAGSKISFAAAPNVAIVGVKEDLISIEEPNGFTAIQMAQARANLGVTKKNYIINGGMQVSQENGASASSASGYYPVDQWRLEFSNAGVVTAAQVASSTPGGSPHRIRLNVATADSSVASTDYAVISQRIEGNRVADLRFGNAAAKTVTVQFGVKAPAGTYCVAIRNGAPNRIIVGEYTITAGEANSDVVRSMSFAGDTTGTWAVDHTIGLELIFVVMAGSSFVQSPNSWNTASSVFATSNQLNIMGTVGNVFELFDVGIYEGSAAPSFELPDYQDELRKCQRYYFQTAANEHLPMSGTLLNGATSGKFSSMPVPATMRADPAVTLGTSAVVTNGPTTGALTAITAVATSHATLMLSLTWSGAGGTAISDALVVFAGTTPTKFNARL
ncbi:hypothetical protein [Bradyrhizobium symbiodeficiens]|uniref:Uncharacterized protein n=1 Tax=Bradyrhizobium symbiodeficiens TaxID=1404367 RepID=A0A6G9A894_9BRAD|nr:hypothetical protein [Bradyrhizobium symbiodeficiens]QIP08534.1 hypothetical protein HAV00_20740 [Bradyrhizobium symbiodeficiens]